MFLVSGFAHCSLLFAGSSGMLPSQMVRFSSILKCLCVCENVSLPLVTNVKVD